MNSAKQILFAHFDPSQCEEYKTTLEGLGAQVTCVSNGREAIEAAQNQSFDLALVSTLLPQVNGFEVCRQVRQLQTAAPSVLLISDDDDPYFRARARHSGANDLLLEPLSREKFELVLSGDWEESSVDDSGDGEARLLEELQNFECAADSGTIRQFADSLTGLFTQEYLSLKSEEELKRCQRYGQDLSLLIAEIDNFDRIVSQHGRRAGDEALLEVAGVFLCESRDTDVAGHVRQAQFQLLMPATPAEGVLGAASRIHHSLTERRLYLDHDEVSLVVNIGSATVPGGEKVTLSELLHRAELDLAVARRRGVIPVSPLPE